MDLEETWKEYFLMLTGKFEDGKITREQYIKRTDTLVAWINVGAERGVL